MMNTLILHYSLEPWEGVQCIGLLPILRLNDGRLFFHKARPRLCPLPAALEVAGSLFSRVRAAMRALGAEVDLRAAAGFYSDLQRLGSRLVELLVPADVIRLLQAGTNVSHLTFCFDPRLNGIPFEWMWLDGDFLGFRFAAGRELLSAGLGGLQQLKAEHGLPYTGRFVLAPPPDLTGGERSEVLRQAMEFFARWTESGRSAKIDFGPVNLSGEFTVADVLQTFQTQEIVSVYSHYVYREAQPGESGYAVSSKEVATARELLAGFAGGQAPPLLVFSLCCESAITSGWEKNWPESGHVFGIVDAAKRIGVPHYIGTLVEVPALKTMAVFVPFYGALGAGHTIGEALRQARVAFRQDPQAASDGGTVLGMALTLYGDPSVALLSGSGCRVAQVHAPVCEAATGTGPCRKTVSPRDPGYALRLCPEHYSPEGCAAGHPLTAGTPLKKCGRCENKLCPQCPGWGQSLCWEHCCYDKHEIFAGLKKTCPDPGARHPGDSRSVCPSDAGWLAGLCRECLGVI